MQEDSAHKSNTDTFSELEVTCNTFTGVYLIRLRSLRLKSNFAVCKEILTVQAFHFRLCSILAKSPLRSAWKDVWSRRSARTSVNCLGA